MKPSVCKRLLAVALPLPLLLSATACGSQAGTNRTNASAPTPDLRPNRSAATEQANQSLRTAAELFETVTEQAFTARWDGLDTMISQADAAVRTIRPELRGEAAATVERQMSALRSARSSQDRVAVAMAAVESYRALVEAQDAASANPPVAVSLLDYAGFRYDALAQARSPDWPEMLRLTQFARQQWHEVAPKVQSRALPGVVDSALAAMTSAAERKDVASARRSAAVELALVDLLEEQVASLEAGRPAGD